MPSGEKDKGFGLKFASPLAKNRKHFLILKLGHFFAVPTEGVGGRAADDDGRQRNERE